jgi:accessory gene regulator protein AgrB
MEVCVCSTIRLEVLILSKKKKKKNLEDSLIKWRLQIHIIVINKEFGSFFILFYAVSHRASWLRQWFL